jgi:(p)ppGpp synthase/HD superfamily hydrolase
MDPLRHVRFFAATKHGDQKYAGGLPYTHHLAAVEAVLQRFGPARVLSLASETPLTDQVMLEAAWLHDVVEDRGVKVKEIREMFGDEVARLVEAVTDEPGENRKARKFATYPKIRDAGPLAVRLKLADRIANVEQGGLSKMYVKEHEDFRRALYTPGENEDMWAHINKLMESGK